MKQIIKLWDKIIVVSLGLLGVFTGCIKPEYGMCVEEYMVKGIVTDKETSNPLQNIQIVKQNRDTIYTDDKGRYSFDNILPEFHLKIEDIDGEENGGYFETKKIDIIFTDDVHFKTQNIELEKKK